MNNTVRHKVKGKTFKEILKIKILDPACGSASFLIRAFDVLVEESERTLKRKLIYEEKKSLMLNCIYGVDLDERAVEMAKLNLTLKLAQIKEGLPVLSDNIKHGNSLIDDKSVEGFNAFVWENEFKEVISNGGFDVVLGNPPWVRAKISCNSQELKFLREKFGMYSVGELNLYKLFIVQALKKCANEGMFSFIVPSSYLSDRDSITLRKWILENFDMEEIVVFSEAGTKKLFNGVITQATTILRVRKKKPTSKSKVRISAYLDAPEALASSNYAFSTINQIDFLKLPDYQLPAGMSLLESEVLLKLLKSDKLGSQIETKDGEVHLTKYSKFITDDKEKNSVLLVRGNHLSEFAIDLRESDRKGGWFKPVEAKISTVMSKEPRIVVQQVSNMSQKRRIKGGILPAGLYAGNSCVSVKAVGSENPLEFILGLLHSDLLNWYFKKLSSTNHVTGRELKSLPFVKPSAEQKKKILVIVKELIDLRAHLQASGANNSKAQLRFDQLFKELNGVVYDMYSITAEERVAIKL